VEHVASIGEKGNAYKILVENCEKKRPLVRHRWQGDIKMDLREIGWKCMNWMHLAQDRDQWRALVNTAVQHIWFPQNTGNFINE